MIKVPVLLVSMFFRYFAKASKKAFSLSSSFLFHTFHPSLIPSTNPSISTGLSTDNICSDKFCQNLTISEATYIISWRIVFTTRPFVSLTGSASFLHMSGFLGCWLLFAHLATLSDTHMTKKHILQLLFPSHHHDWCIFNQSPPFLPYLKFHSLFGGHVI